MGKLHGRTDGRLRASARSHAEHFARKSDEEFAEYGEKKVASGLDGLPALPVPLPPRTV
ncbi:hypothetical protein ACWGHA_12540 [Streptomyces xanthophaeus]